MAEALISLLVEQLGSVVYHHTNQGVKLVLNAKKDVKKFSDTLKLIQNVVQDAEKKQVSDPNVRDWLDQLKDVSYKMNDELDAWNTEIGKRQASDERKVRFSFPSYCMCLPHFSEVIRRYKIGSTIKVLNEDLDQIYIDKNKYSLQSTMPAAVNVEQRRITAAFVDISTIFGRQDEKDGLVRKLLSEGRPGLVMPIVGMGGLGKTTFTQLVFQDAQVQAHFDNKAWVCVSDPFDVIKVAKAINDQLGGPQVTSNELNALLGCIERNIKDKKTLLVLDDVWTEDQTEWDRLSLPVIMKTCAKGSSILVTTRKQEVARIMRATSDVIILDKLSHSDSLELFNNVAFLDREQDKSNKGFGDTAEKIVRKCGGLPLVLKTLGGLLLHKITIGEWVEVLNSEIWKVKVVQEEVFRPLLLSYYDLAPEIKSCLLYCSTFPKDFEFSIEMLIEQWMSQGYLNVRENRDETTEGREVFNKLVMRCFFQDFQKHALTKEIIGCKMHDTVHDFVQFLTQNECYTMEAMDTHGIETSIANDTTKPRPGDKVRHLTLMFADEDDFPSSIVNCEILRTLATFDSIITRIDSNLIRRLKRLRTLNLGRNDVTQLPEEIGDLMHLRYIDLSGNRELSELPDSVCNLYNLQTLRLYSCESLAKLPDNMGKLINLKHLHLDFCKELRYLPKGIGNIRNLRTLDAGRDAGSVYCSEDAEALTLGDLSMMNQLRRLSIKIERIGEDAASKAEKAELRKKELVSHLKLLLPQGGDDNLHAGLMDALQPHENLESLILYRYKGSTWPTWMTTSYLTRLTALHLVFSSSSVLPPLGKLPSLKVLKLWGILSLKEIGGEFFGVEETSSSSFPSLETLVLHRLREFEKWELGNGEAEDSSNSQMKSISIMPRLSSLYIVMCPKLKQLPDFLLQNAPLQNLLIDDCDSFGSLHDGFISRIPNVTIIRSGVDPFIKGRKIDYDRSQD